MLDNRIYDVKPSETVLKNCTNNTNNIPDKVVGVLDDRRCGVEPSVTEVK